MLGGVLMGISMTMGVVGGRIRTMLRARRPAHAVAMFDVVLRGMGRFRSAIPAVGALAARFRFLLSLPPAAAEAIDVDA